MRLDRLEVRDFRNIARADLALAPGINLLWGANAQGKTNLLEAIAFLVMGRSFRTRRERECVRREGADDQGERTAFIRGQVVRAQGQFTLQVALQGPQRRVEIDGAPIAKLAALWGKLNAVIFTPDDLQIVKGPPALRRQFLDEGISQIRPAYLAWLQRYHAALRERSALLRQAAWNHIPHAELDAWDAALAEAAAEIQGHRADVIARLERLARATHCAVSGGAETLRLVHSGFLETDAPLTREECIARHRDLLLEARASDVERGVTSVGPHRDDLWIFLGDVDVRSAASQGQQRAVVLALRLAEVALMEEETGETPLLLLDDILSELDPERRQRLFAQIRPDVQTVVTTVEPPQALRGVPVGEIFTVDGGTFRPAGLSSGAGTACAG